jgi:phenylalanyl-tRNA synthetase alpha chain
VIERIQAIVSSGEAAVEKTQNIKEVEECRVRFLGKSGELTLLLKELGSVPAESKPQIGKALNEAKNKITALLDAKKEAFEEQQSQKADPTWDPTLPGRSLPFGKLHPLTRVQKDICAIFTGMGFDLVEGPDVETDDYNFLKLNFPLDHPARDAHDTFYLSEKVLMRTHTTPVQVRVMESGKPPFKVVTPGRVYRKEAIDATHHHIFHQVDGFLLDEGVNFGHLKGTLDTFVKKFFGAKIQTRFRPSFFPFTEPSAEVDISCPFCDGKGCGVCKQSGWIELMGCGMIDPAVLENCNIDPEKWTGFAFGMGVERIAISKYHVDDIRLFYQNDNRFLNQF